VVVALLTLGTFFALRRLAGLFRSDSSGIVEEKNPAMSQPSTAQAPMAQAQVAQALSQALNPLEEVEAEPRSDIQRLASVIVEVHDKVSPYFAEQGQAITLRDMLRSVDLLSALSLQKNLMSVFEILHLVLGMQFTEAAQREEVFRMIEDVRLSQGAMVAGIEQSFHHAADPEAEMVETAEGQPSQERLREQVRRALSEESVRNLATIYSHLAGQEGLSVEAWLARTLRNAEPEEFESLLETLGWDEHKVLEWIDTFGLQSGVPWLLDCLKRGTDFMRGRAAFILGDLKVNSAEVEAALVETLGDSHRPNRFYAAGSLQRLGCSHPRIGEIEAEINGDILSRDFIRQSVITYLHTFKTLSADSRKAILQAIGEDPSTLNNVSFWEYACLQGPDLESVVVSGLSHLKGVSLIRALEYLTNVGSRHPGLLATLNQWIEGSDPFQQTAAASTLAAMGLASPPVEDILRRRMEDAWYWGKILAATGLDHLGVQDPEIERSLQGCLNLGLDGNEMEVVAKALLSLKNNRQFIGESVSQLLSPRSPAVQVTTLRHLAAQAEVPDQGPVLSAFQNGDSVIQREAFAVLQKHFSGWDEAVPDSSDLNRILNEEVQRRLTDSDVAEKHPLQSLLDQLPQWGAETEQRKEIRRWLAKEENSDWEAIYREVAKMQGVEWNLWQVAFLRGANPAQANRFLDRLGMNPIDEGKWLAQHRIQAGLPRLLSRLDDPDDKVRQNVLHSLRDFDIKDPELTERIAEKLQDPSPEVQLEAVDLLQRNGSVPGSLAAILVPLTAHQETDIRLRTISLLAKETQSEAVEKALISLLDDSSWWIRAKAAECIDKLGISSKAAIAELREMLNERDHDCLLNAAAALLHLGQNDSEVDATLAGLLPDEVLNARYLNLVEKLKKLKPLPLPLFEATLVQRLGDPEHISDDRVADLLFHWGMKEELRQFAKEHRNHPNPRFQIRAAEILARLGEASTSDLNFLLESFNSSNSQIQAIANRALHLIGAESAHVKNALQTMVENGDFEAMLLLAQLDPKGPYAAHGLLNCLGSDIEHVRSKAIDTLVELKIGGPEIQAALLECVQDPDPFSRWEAAWALGILNMRGPEVDAAVLPLIQEVAADVTVSLEAAQLFDSIQPGWDRQVAAEGRDLLKLVEEELQTEVSEVQQEASESLGGGLTHLPTWSGRDSKGKAFDAKKLEELRAFIPGPERLTMIGPTIEALRGLMAGIISNTPVYLMAVTGVGKNAMLRYLAHITGTPLYRINFGKETDEGQLYGHFEVEVFENEQGEKKKRIVIQDGKMIEAIKNGGWCLWDEANLASEAFLVAQNDIIQQLKSGKVRVKQGGKIVEIPVHPNFRLFAAGNPEGYGGRKPTEKSFGSRWLKVAVREFRVEEQQAILHEEFADWLTAESSDHIPQVLHALKVAAGGEVVTLRTLKRV
ncbi:MAG TPA: HEAT repeat domain-containing protein, partial [bacterium]|nr:HEAT repeat domain-containing protein [bacterium]